jgi:uncharacterized glyoxalase superfamily protein PhnB
MPKPKLHEAVPVFLVSDIAKTMLWYSAELGFQARAVPPKPPHAFCILSRDGVRIFLQQLDGYEPPDHYEARKGGVWSVYLQTDAVASLYETLSESENVTILEPLEHMPYGQTEFVIRDPNGYVIVLAQRD